MEQVNLGYSMKNIPMPSKKVYLQMLINSIEKFTRNLRWRAYFFQNPNSKPNSKKTYNFKSLTPAPFVEDLKEFEDKLANLLKEIKFTKKHNNFQNKLEKDLKEIQNAKQIFASGDKT